MVNKAINRISYLIFCKSFLNTKMFTLVMFEKKNQNISLSISVFLEVASISIHHRKCEYHKSPKFSDG